MPDNRISASLSQADRHAVLDAVNTIRTNPPFLVDLSPEERQALPRMGDRSRGFVEQALTVATRSEGKFRGFLHENSSLQADPRKENIERIRPQPGVSYPPSASRTGKLPPAAQLDRTIRLFTPYYVVMPNHSAQ